MTECYVRAVHTRALRCDDPDNLGILILEIEQPGRVPPIAYRNQILELALANQVTAHIKGLMAYEVFVNNEKYRDT